MRFRSRWTTACSIAEGRAFLSDVGDPQSLWVPGSVRRTPVLVNGKLFPYLQVEPRKYRFRVLNASNARLSSSGFLERHQSFPPGRNRSGSFAGAGSIKNAMVAPPNELISLLIFPDMLERALFWRTIRVPAVMQFRVEKTGSVGFQCASALSAPGTPRHARTQAP